MSRATFQSLIASFRPSGFANTGSPGTTNAERVGTTYNFTSNFTWIRDKHTFKLGGDLRMVSGAVSNPQTQPQGRFSFDRNYTSNNGAANNLDSAHVNIFCDNTRFYELCKARCSGGCG